MFLVFLPRSHILFPPSLPPDFTVPSQNGGKSSFIEPSLSPSSKERIPAKVHESYEDFQTMQGLDLDVLDWLT